MRFDNKSVVIFGGSTGIGLAAAQLFRAEGAAVAITGRDEKALRAARDGLGVIALQSDMGVIAQTKATLAEIKAQFGSIDVLCVNAGVGGFAPVPDVTEAFWDGIHTVNLRGAFFALQQALPLLRDGGSIVITGSIGSVAAVPGNVAYAAAKAGLRAVARIVGKELLPRNIRVNMVSPGPTDTDIFKRGASAGDIAGVRAMMAQVVPQGRMGTSAEIARAIVFLASEDASFINGVDLYVDGGCVEL
jgi:NAD(P)-dependent dehydrogenase (short-subunit alcohol dehydrogenase family)